MDTSGKPMAPGGPHRRQSVWAAIGIALAVMLAIGGLVVVGCMVVFFVALSHYGSNK